MSQEGDDSRFENSYLQFDNGERTREGRFRRSVYLCQLHSSQANPSRSAEDQDQLPSAEIRADLQGKVASAATQHGATTDITC